LECFVTTKRTRLHTSATPLPLAGISADAPLPASRACAEQLRYFRCELAALEAGFINEYRGHRAASSLRRAFVISGLSLTAGRSRRAEAPPPSALVRGKVRNRCAVAYVRRLPRLAGSEDSGLLACNLQFSTDTVVTAIYPPRPRGRNMSDSPVVGDSRPPAPPTVALSRSTFALVLGFTAHLISGDGMCLFYAILFGLFMDKKFFIEVAGARVRVGAARRFLGTQAAYSMDLRDA